MRTRLSICNRKLRYASRPDALAAAVLAGVSLRDAGRDGTLRAYRCDRCGQFHLTSRTKGKRVPRGGADVSRT